MDKRVQRNLTLQVQGTQPLVRPLHLLLSFSQRQNHAHQLLINSPQNGEWCPTTIYEAVPSFMVNKKYSH